ncbi:hypothetical protein D3C86_1398870 [compost metagenome]
MGKRLTPSARPTARTWPPASFASASIVRLPSCVRSAVGWVASSRPCSSRTLSETSEVWPGTPSGEMERRAFSATTTLAVARASAQRAVMTTVPGRSARTRPASSTVATRGSEDCQPIASDGLLDWAAKRNVTGKSGVPPSTGGTKRLSVAAFMVRVTAAGAGVGNTSPRSEPIAPPTSALGVGVGCGTPVAGRPSSSGAQAASSEQRPASKSMLVREKMGCRTGVRTDSTASRGSAPADSRYPGLQTSIPKT